MENIDLPKLCKAICKFLLLSPLKAQQVGHARKTEEHRQTQNDKTYDAAQTVVKQASGEVVVTHSFFHAAQWAFSSRNVYLKTCAPVKGNPLQHRLKKTFAISMRLQDARFPCDQNR